MKAPKVFYPELPKLPELINSLSDTKLNIGSSFQQREIKIDFPQIFYPELPELAKLDDPPSKSKSKSQFEITTCNRSNKSTKEKTKLSFLSKTTPILSNEQEQKQKLGSNQKSPMQARKKSNYEIFTFEFEDDRIKLKLDKSSQLKDHIKQLRYLFKINSTDEIKFKSQIEGEDIKEIDNLETTMCTFINKIIHIYILKDDFINIISRDVKFDDIKKTERPSFINPSLMGDLQPQLHKKERFLGEGGTSTVYKVNHIDENNEYDEMNKTFYAIKIIKKHLIKINKSSKKHKFKSWEEDDNDYDEKSDEDQNEEEEELDINKLKNFLFEYEIVQELKHQNIIKTFGFSFGNQKYAPFIHLEYIKHNLDNSIEILEDVYLVTIIYEISKAMKFVHDHGIIHRNLKPLNILLDKNKHVKISDFGIAKLMDNETQSSTEFGCGTRRFMAPELFQGNKFTNKVDVYSFGVIVHFILTRGKLPEIIIGKKNQIKITNKINQNSRELIKRCLSFSSEERPSFIDIVDFIEEREKIEFLLKV